MHALHTRTAVSRYVFRSATLRISIGQESDAGPLRYCAAMTQQQSLLHKLPSELLGTVIDAVQSPEDLLRLSTSCQLFRNTMTGSFWQRVLDEPCKVINSISKSCKKAMPPRKQVIQLVLRTCYGCQSLKTCKLGKHDILEKRMCVTCIHYKYEMMPVTRAKKLYKLKEEDLAGLRVALNPVNHS